MRSRLHRRRRLERRCRFVEGLAPDVAVGLHHLRRHVPNLRLDDPVWQALLGQRRDGRVPSVVEPNMRQAGVPSPHDDWVLRRRSVQGGTHRLESSIGLVSGRILPPPTDTHRPGGVCALAIQSRTNVAISASVFAFTCRSQPPKSTIPIGWRWISINPGRTSLPPASPPAF